MIELVSTPIDTARLLAAVHDPRCGATVLFLGTVRELTGTEQTVALEYEAYAPMAMKKLHEIAGEITQDRELVKFACVHRLGRLEVGEVAVAVAVSTPHRAEAFALCSTAMERIKALVPIWKKDFTPQGESAWVLPTPTDGGSS